MSYYEHNKYASGEKIVARLLAGETCALVTDAGMPAISDPGEDIVRQCAEQGIDVTVIPARTRPSRRWPIRPADAAALLRGLPAVTAGPGASILSACAARARTTSSTKRRTSAAHRSATCATRSAAARITPRAS
ncbi:MAG: hypothetical protein ACLSHG_10225 [Oscillospiraceae bacterium]